MVVFLQRLAGTDTIDEIIFDRLLPTEKIVMIDGPAQIAFYFQQKWSILLVIASLVAAGISDSVVLTAISLGVGLVVAVFFVVRAIQLHYTRYVVTTNRILYLSGVINRTHQWIPWAKVTDLSMEQPGLDRLQNIGRVLIESANEESEFRVMKNLTNPETMMRVLVYMVSQRQGTVPVPDDIHAILGVPGPDGITHLPKGYRIGGDDGDGDGPDSDGDGGVALPGDTGPPSGGDGGDGGDPAGPGWADVDDDAGDRSPPSRDSASPVPSAAAGPLAPGTVTVPKPARGEESRPSRANPVQDVGIERPPGPDPGRAALDD